MNRTQALIAAGALAAGGIVALASNVAAQNADPEDIDEMEDGAEGPDVPIPSPDLERASAVALDHIGEGRVTGTEIEDEESYYEVEVRRDDGSEVDVQLDEDFNVVGTN